MSKKNPGIHEGTMTVDGKKWGYIQWGVGGTKYKFEIGNKRSRAQAYAKAMKQAAAHYANRGG